MKRIIALITVVISLLALPACRKAEENPIIGEVVTCGGNPLFFEVACENGKNYGFVVTDSTQLVWEDKRAFINWDVDAGKWDIFSISMYVEVVPGERAQSADEYVNECVEGWYYAEKVTVTGINESYFAVDYKPVIYLYPEHRMDVEVFLDYNGLLTCTYPTYTNGWHVTAEPDGTLTDEKGMEYNYLYWEGISAAEYDFTRGFCIPGSETGVFLEAALAQLGLTRREANEFIVYWLPLMEVNDYNLISFQTEAYTEHAVLRVSPAPDTVLRVFMAWKPLEEAVDIEPQALTRTERIGFTLVEWGGAKAE